MKKYTVEKSKINLGGNIKLCLKGKEKYLVYY